MTRRAVFIHVLAASAPLSAVAQTTPDTMPPNSWLAVPNTPMKAVTPKDGQFAGTWGNTGPNSVIVAWGGAALDTRRNRLVLWGGGHADYHGNELYVFDIASLKWQRLTDPFVNPVNDQEVNADGTPNSRHTYGGLAYIAHADRFFGQAGSLAGVGFAKCDKTWTYDFDAKAWSDRAPAMSPGGGFGVTCSYDSVGKKLWWGATSGGNGLWSYAYDTNTWTKHNGDAVFYDHTSAIDPKRGLFFVVGGGKLLAYDIRSANPTQQVWATTGGDAFLAKGKPGLDYDPVSDRIVGWHGGAVYVLNVDTKTWTAYDAPGAPATTSNGIYGRWRYVPSVNAFIVVTDWSADVHFYKLSSGKGMLPDGGIVAAADAGAGGGMDAGSRDAGSADARTPTPEAGTTVGTVDAGGGAAGRGGSAGSGGTTAGAGGAGGNTAAGGAGGAPAPSSVRKASGSSGCSLGAGDAPAGLVLALMGLVGLAAARRRR
jgi:MYXO-CTERM domain-containing protein